MNSNTLDLIRSNDHRTISKVITNIENDQDISNTILVFNADFLLRFNSI